jgi:hypothetical protein
MYLNDKVDRKQNSLDGYRWVEVGKKIQLQSGEEIELNQDGKFRCHLRLWQCATHLLYSQSFTHH